MNTCGKYAELTAHDGTKYYTHIYDKTAPEIIEKWLKPGYWKSVKFLAPIVADFSDTGTKIILLGVYTVSDEFMKEHNLSYKYRAESVTVNANNEAFTLDQAIS